MNWNNIIVASKAGNQSHLRYAYRMDMFPRLLQILLLAGFSLATGCRTISTSDISPRPVPEILLPALDLHLLDPPPGKLDSPFPEKTANMSFQPGIFAMMPDAMAMQVPVPAELREETRLLLKNHLENRLCAKPSALQPAAGHVVVQVLNRTTEDKISWCFYSGLTLLMGNMLGMPFVGQEYSVDVKLEILDRNQKLVYQTRTHATGCAYCAFYWGYDQFQMREMAHAKAFMNAMEAIMRDTASSAPAIRNNLAPQSKR